MSRYGLQAGYYITNGADWTQGGQSLPTSGWPYCDNEAALLELYDRLNFGGTPHREADRVRPANRFDIR